MLWQHVLRIVWVGAVAACLVYCMSRILFRMSLSMDVRCAAYSVRLVTIHRLWPQDKRLHTLRNTDYRHTRQDTWIQTELVSALAKNATKPNPFEILLLQTTRKENNWKTEETLERAVVNLEKERIKGSNAWCLLLLLLFLCLVLLLAVVVFS